jgi:uncharacterized protein YqeY
MVALVIRMAVKIAQVANRVVRIAPVQFGAANLPSRSRSPQSKARVSNPALHETLASPLAAVVVAHGSGLRFFVRWRQQRLVRRRLFRPGLRRARVTRVFPMPSIYDTLRADIVAAMKARDAAKAQALRTTDAAIQRAAMDQNKPIDDALVTVTVRKAVKNLSDAKVEFEKGGRADLVAANEAEIRLLEKYLPAALDTARLEALVDAAIKETGAQSKKEMGKVIGALKKHPDAGLIDFGAISKVVQAKLP